MKMQQQSLEARRLERYVSLYSSLCLRVWSKILFVAVLSLLPAPPRATAAQHAATLFYWLAPDALIRRRI